MRSSPVFVTLLVGLWNAGPTLGGPVPETDLGHTERLSSFGNTVNGLAVDVYQWGHVFVAETGCAMKCHGVIPRHGLEFAEGDEIRDRDNKLIDQIHHGAFIISWNLLYYPVYATCQPTSEEPFLKNETIVFNARQGALYSYVQPVPNVQTKFSVTIRKTATDLEAIISSPELEIMPDHKQQPTLINSTDTPTHVWAWGEFVPIAEAPSSCITGMDGVIRNAFVIPERDIRLISGSPIFVKKGNELLLHSTVGESMCSSVYSLPSISSKVTCPVKANMRNFFPVLPIAFGALLAISAINIAYLDSVTAQNPNLSKPKSAWIQRFGVSSDSETFPAPFCPARAPGPDDAPRTRLAEEVTRFYALPTTTSPASSATPPSTTVASSVTAPSSSVQNRFNVPGHLVDFNTCPLVADLNNVPPLIPITRHPPATGAPLPFSEWILMNQRQDCVVNVVPGTRYTKINIYAIPRADGTFRFRMSSDDPSPLPNTVWHFVYSMSRFRYTPNNIAIRVFADATSGVSLPNGHIMYRRVVVIPVISDRPPLVLRSLGGTNSDVGSTFNVDGMYMHCGTDYRGRTVFIYPASAPYPPFPSFHGAPVALAPGIQSLGSVNGLFPINSDVTRTVYYVGTSTQPYVVHSSRMHVIDGDEQNAYYALQPAITRENPFEREVPIGELIYANGLPVGMVTMGILASEDCAITEITLTTAPTRRLAAREPQYRRSILLTLDMVTPTALEEVSRRAARAPAYRPPRPTATTTSPGRCNQVTRERHVRHHSLFAVA